MFKIHFYMKRLFYFLIVVLALVAVYQWSSGVIDEVHLSLVKKNWSSPSVFTDRKVIQKQLVYEGKKVLVLYNYKPLLTGHLLIIPKREVARLEDLTPEEWAEMQEVIVKMNEVYKKAYQAPDYLLILQNGLFAGQTVPHFHFHMLPRDNQQIVYIKLKLWQAFITESLGLRKPLQDDELQNAIHDLKEHM